jgi:hypothetical protein
MLTKKAIFMLLIVLSMGTLIHAQDKGTIVFTTRPDFIDPDTGESPDMWHIYALEDAGYEVITFYNASLSTASQETLDTLYNANLIILGRSTPSTGYQDPQKQVWNSIPTPTLCLEMWAIRNTRLNWLNTTAINNNTEEGVYAYATIDVPDDPVFEGLDTSAPVPWMISPYDVMGVTEAGNGTVLARMESDSTVLFVRWEPDVEFYDGSVDYPAGHRTLIGNGRDNSSAAPFDYYNFTEESEQVFLAEVARMVALGAGSAAINPNGSFEEGTLGLKTGTDIPGWNLMLGGTGAATFEVTSDEYIDGVQALMVTTTTLGSNAWDIQVVNEPFNVQAGVTYQYSIWAMADIEGPIVNFTVGNPSYAEFGRADQVVMTTGWQQVTFEFTVPADNTTGRAPIHLSENANTTYLPITYYLDDLKIVPTVTGVADRNNQVPVKFSLSQNYPNPFNPTTTIPFYLPEKSHVRLSLANILGQEIREIVDGEYGAGQHEVVFNAGNLAAGIYFYKIETERYTEVKKLALVK